MESHIFIYMTFQRMCVSNKLHLKFTLKGKLRKPFEKVIHCKKKFVEQVCHPAWLRDTQSIKVMKKVYATHNEPIL